MSIISASTTSTTAYKVTADTTGTLVLQTGSTPTTAVTIDTSQNVGVGTASPAYKLDVAGTANAAAVNTTLAYGTSGEVYSSFRFSNSSFSGGNSEIRNIVNGAGSTGSALALFTTQTGTSTLTERLRIDNQGSLLVGTTIASGFATFSNAISSTFATASISRNTTGNAYGHYSGITGQTPNNNSSLFYYGSDATALRFAVYANGGIGNYSANNVNLSDSREKINVSPAGNYLTKICAIPVRTYNYIDQNLEEDDGLTLGVFAQDVQEVAPELVMESNWAKENDEPKMRLSIYQTDLQYALMKCIQEQQAIIETLTNRISALENK